MIFADLNDNRANNVLYIVIKSICILIIMTICFGFGISAKSEDITPYPGMGDGTCGPYLDTRYRIITIRLGEEASIKVRGMYINHVPYKMEMSSMLENGELSFESLDPDIAVVTETGVIKPKKSGNTKIKVSVLGMGHLDCYPAYVEVKVLERMPELSFFKKRMRVKKGSSKTLSLKKNGVKKVCFRLKTAKMHRIIKLVKKKPDSVVIKAKRKGKAVVIAKASGKTASCKVVVK